MRILRIIAVLGSLCFPALSGDTSQPAVVPEPSLAIIMGAALAGVGVVAWRRNRKR